MNAESKELLLQHIKSGHDVPDICLSIQKMLENACTGVYAKACCSRIETAGLVDGVHILHECPGHWNLVVDYCGMKKCMEILESYIYADNLKSVYEASQAHHKWVISTNNILYALRKMSMQDLKECRYEALGLQIKLDEVEDIRELLHAEMECRKFPARLRQMSERAAFVCHMLIMFRGPFRMLVPFIREAWAVWEEHGDSSQPEKKGKYSKAMRRFLDVHGGNSGIGRLQGDDLIRYIYLAVKAYGKEGDTEYRHERPKLCREIVYRYQELKQLMDAIGRLTPQRLLHMYPVTKQYDGVKWGEKDYFFTMKRMRHLPGDEPIGDAQDVACLLWDYQNWDLECLLICWMEVLSDMSVYCNENGPNDQFHERLLRRGSGKDTAVLN